MKFVSSLFSSKPKNQGFEKLDLAPKKMEEFVHTKNVDNIEKGATLTVFFNGTCSSIAKDTNPSLNYPEGELVSNLYANCTGPCIQVDGVATGSENSMYNVAIGSGVTNRIKAVHDFIREHPGIKEVNIVGWSRGGVEAIMLANALDGARKGYRDLGVDVNIMAFDPVPGTDGLENDKDMKATLGKNVRTYKAFYARDETSNSFSPVVPDIDSNIENPETVIDMKVVPGRHATLVGNYSVRGDKLKPNDLMVFGSKKEEQRLKELNGIVQDGFDPDMVNNVHETGTLVRDEAEKTLQKWGTPLNNTLDLSKKQIEKYEALQEENSGVYQNMRNHTYGTPSNGINDQGLGAEKGDRLMHRVHAFDSMAKQKISNFEENLADYNVGPDKGFKGVQLEEDVGPDKGSKSGKLEDIVKNRKFSDSIILEEVQSSAKPKYSPNAKPTPEASLLFD